MRYSCWRLTHRPFISLLQALLHSVTSLANKLHPVVDAADGSPAALEDAGGRDLGAGFVADVVELDVEAWHGLPAAAPRRRQHRRAHHVAGWQAAEDLVEDVRREVTQEVHRTLRRLRWLRFARGKHGLVAGSTDLISRRNNLVYVLSIWTSVGNQCGVSYSCIIHCFLVGRMF